MGVIISRYMDPSSSEGALIKFIVDSVELVRTVCTADAYFPELTPWNVIDFRADDFRDLFSWPSFLRLDHSPPADGCREGVRAAPGAPDFGDGGLLDGYCHDEDLLYFSSSLHATEAL